MDSTHPRELKQISIVFVGAVLLRMLLAHAMNAASIFTDEYEYVELARSFSFHNALLWDNHPAFYPCYFYPMLISPFVKHLPWDFAYVAIRSMNAVLMALAVFPAYFLARRLTDHRRALAAAILTALLPGCGYSPMIMTESLFLPLFLLAAYAIYLAVLEPTAFRRLAAGFLCGMAFHVKPHGILLPLSMGVVVLLFEADRLRDAPAPKGGRLLAYLAGVSRHWLTALGWIIALLPRIYAVKHLEHNPVNISTILGNYAGLAAGKHPYTHFDLALSFLRSLASWSWSAGLLPVALLGRKIYTSILRREDPATRLMVLLTVVLSAAMLILVARHTLVTNSYWEVHERYYFVTLPLVLILFCACAKTSELSAGGHWLWDIVLFGVVMLNVWAANEQTWTLASTSPTFTGAVLFLHVMNASNFVLALMILPVLIGVILLYRRVQTFERQAAIVALFLVAFNVGWYGFYAGRKTNERADRLKLVGKVASTVGRKGSLYVLKDGLDQSLLWDLGVRLPGPALAIDPEACCWYEDKLDVASDGHLRLDKPVAPTFLLAPAGWKFNRAPEKDFSYYDLNINKYAAVTLYRLDGRGPLRLDPNQVAAYKVGLNPPAAALKPLNLKPYQIAHYKKNPVTTQTLVSGIDYTTSLSLNIVTQKIPAVMTVGKLAYVQATIRNDSRFALPGGLFRIELGYHWADPIRLRDYKSIVWDDEHSVRLPEWMAPGTTATVTLSVMPPDKPGDQYLFSMRPLLVTGGVRKRSLSEETKPSKTALPEMPVKRIWALGRNAIVEGKTGGVKPVWIKVTESTSTLSAKTQFKKANQVGQKP